MTNLIAKVREMREVGDFVATTAEMDALLTALGKVQEGDAHKLDEIIEMIDFSIPSELMSVEESDEDFDIAPSEYQEMIQMKATLQRYADLARLMEDSP
jgi:hypothetical protein